MGNTPNMTTRLHKNLTSNEVFKMYKLTTFCTNNIIIIDVLHSLQWISTEQTTHTQSNIHLYHTVQV